MDAVRSWAIALCAAAIGCTLLQILAPKDGMGRIFKLLIAAFFLCCLAAPLLQIKNLTRLDFSGLPDEVASGVLQQRVNEQAVSQINAALEEIAGHAVERYGTKWKKSPSRRILRRMAAYISDKLSYRWIRKTPTGPPRSGRSSKAGWAWT